VNKSTNEESIPSMAATDLHENCDQDEKLFSETLAFDSSMLMEEGLGLVPKGVDKRLTIHISNHEI
jgi:hypothetical protein